MQRKGSDKMINQYIENLLLETNEDIERFQYQLAGLMEELNYSQEKREKLQRERNKDSNIFSPRSMTSAMDEKLDKAKEEVKNINQQVEYIREKIENSTKKKLEYETLLAELEKKDEKSNISNEEKGQAANTDSDAATELINSMNSYFDQYKNNMVQNEKDNDSEVNISIKETEDVTEIKEFLQKIYKSTEICLALINGDKNRCRNELKKMKNEIKRFSEGIENN